MKSKVYTMYKGYGNMYTAYCPGLMHSLILPIGMSGDMIVRDTIVCRSDTNVLFAENCYNEDKQLIDEINNNIMNTHLKKYQYTLNLSRLDKFFIKVYGGTEDDEIEFTLIYYEPINEDGTPLYCM